MNIQMLTTEKGSIDGIAVKEYTQGEYYDLGGSPREMELARAFVKAGLAQEVAAKKVPAPASIVPVVDSSLQLVSGDNAGSDQSEEVRAGGVEHQGDDEGAVGGQDDQPSAATTTTKAAAKKSAPGKAGK